MTGAVYDSDSAFSSTFKRVMACSPSEYRGLQRALRAFRHVGRSLQGFGILRTPVDFHWISDDRLVAAGIEGWTELPLWLPEDDAEAGGIFLADNQLAVGNGLRFRSVADTVSATLKWWHSEGSKNVSPLAVNTLSAEKEQKLLPG